MQLIPPCRPNPSLAQISWYQPLGWKWPLDGTRWILARPLGFGGSGGTRKYFNLPSFYLPPLQSVCIMTHYYCIIIINGPSYSSSSSCSMRERDEGVNGPKSPLVPWTLDKIKSLSLSSQKTVKMGPSREPPWDLWWVGVFFFFFSHNPLCPSFGLSLASGEDGPGMKWLPHTWHRKIAR